jgi:hypothetical protein
MQRQRGVLRTTIIAEAFVGCRLTKTCFRLPAQRASPNNKKCAKSSLACRHQTHRMRISVLDPSHYSFPAFITVAKKTATSRIVDKKESKAVSLLISFEHCTHHGTCKLRHLSVVSCRLLLMERGESSGTPASVRTSPIRIPT